MKKQFARDNPLSVAVRKYVVLYNAYLQLLKAYFADRPEFSEMQISPLEENQVFSLLSTNKDGTDIIDLSTIFVDISLAAKLSQSFGGISSSSSNINPGSSPDNLEFLRSIPLSLKRNIFELYAYRDRLTEERGRHPLYIESLLCSLYHRMQSIFGRMTLLCNGICSVLQDQNLFQDALGIDSEWRSFTVESTGEPLIRNEASGEIWEDIWVQLGLLDSSMTSGIITTFARAYARHYQLFILGLQYLDRLSPKKAAQFKFKLNGTEAVNFEFHVDGKFEDNDAENDDAEVKDTESEEEDSEIDGEVHDHNCESRSGSAGGEDVEDKDLYNA